MQGIVSLQGGAWDDAVMRTMTRKVIQLDGMGKEQECPGGFDSCPADLDRCGPVLYDQSLPELEICHSCGEDRHEELSLGFRKELRTYKRD